MFESSCIGLTPVRSKRNSSVDFLPKKAALRSNRKDAQLAHELHCLLQMPLSNRQRPLPRQKKSWPMLLFSFDLLSFSRFLLSIILKYLYRNTCCNHISVVQYIPMIEICQSRKFLQITLLFFYLIFYYSCYNI